MTLDASAKLTRVEAVHTDPVQWLKTTVEVVGCQLTRRTRSCPRESGSTSVRAPPSSTSLSMVPSHQKCFGCAGAAVSRLCGPLRKSTA